VVLKVPDIHLGPFLGVIDVQPIDHALISRTFLRG
jgi:hypothetical protein